MLSCPFVSGHPGGAFRHSVGVFLAQKTYLAPTPLKKVSYFLNRMYNATEAIITGYCTIFVVDDGFINGVLSVPVYLCFFII